MFTHLRTAAATCVAMALFLTGCVAGGSDPVSPEQKPAVPVETPQVQRMLQDVVVTGPSSVTQAGSENYRVIARYNTEPLVVEVTTSAQVTSSDPSRATIGSDGKLVALTPGAVQVVAQYEGKTGTLPVTVMPRLWTPWSELPAISDAAKAMVRTNFNGQGQIMRWRDTVRVWADATLSEHYNIAVAAKFWTDSTFGKVVMIVAQDSASANLVIAMDPFSFSGTEPCADFNVKSSQGEILSGHISIRSIGAGCDRLSMVMHEIGHVLGVFTHTPDGPNSDVMGPTGSTSKVSVVLSEYLNWLYRVPLGTKPVD